jgi:crossover junction endodeoxyribonuclease RuvC
MVKTLLEIRQSPKLFDVTDALAVALCHLQRRGSPRPHPSRKKSNGKARNNAWKEFIKAHPERVIART